MNVYIYNIYITYNIYIYNIYIHTQLQPKDFCFGALDLVCYDCVQI